MDDVWTMLVEQAKAQAPCHRGTTTCHVQVLAGPLYAVLSHYDVPYHACEVCPEGTPQHVVSIETLQTVKRGALVARLARWLDHSHRNDQGTELRAA